MIPFKVVEMIAAFHVAQRCLFAALSLGVLSHTAFAQSPEIPAEPVAIGAETQFVFDRYIIDNVWAIRYKSEAVQRVFHPPEKHPSNPIIAGDGGCPSVLRDEQTGSFRMWYQTWKPSEKEGESGSYAIAYAESDDGVAWKRPTLGLLEWKGTKENNIVWKGLDGKRGSQVFMLDLPEEAKRGYRYVMLWGGRGGSHLIGSQDGLTWDRASDTVVASMHSDTTNAIVYDTRRREYVMYCRPKHIFRTFRGDVIDTGASRRVARMSSKELWTKWSGEPQTIFVPDEQDAKERFHFFYGMPVRYHAGVYFGFVWPFKMNTDIHTELAWSRDGVRFERLSDRPKFIAQGPQGAWDDGMVFAGSHWVEVGDQWWFYYAGWDGPHQSKDRSPGIGLATMRKEGFISMHGPRRGGVLCTRKLIWPGGELRINAQADQGQLKVRLSDAQRKVIPGFDYGDCIPFTGDSVSHAVQWKNGSVADLAGQTIRVEFYLENADLYTFRAATSPAMP